MIEHSHRQETWFSIGQIAYLDSRWVIHDLLVRWNERKLTINGPEGAVVEYVYDAYRFDMEIPIEVQPGIEAVEYYIEQAKSAILIQAQNLAAQEVGFLDPN